MLTSKTKQLYIRRIFPHDLTHEVSVTTEIVNDFFEGKSTLNFYKGENRDVVYKVTINNATDPRFGGDFSSLWSIDNLQIDDFIVIKKLNGLEYELTTAKSGCPAHQFLKTIHR